jgi:hypothetical protein
VGGDTESKCKAMQQSEQRAIKGAAVAAAKEQENVAKAEAKAAKREAQQTQKAVAAGTNAKSARAGCYRVAGDKCPLSWQEDHRPAIGQLRYAQSIISAAPAPSAPSCSYSLPSFTIYS